MKRIRLGVFLILLTVFMAGLACVSASAADKIDIVEGVYRIKAVSGNAKGQYLYYSPDLNYYRQCQFQPYKDYGEYDPKTFFNDPNADRGQLWFIQYDANKDYYLIYNYSGYSAGSENNKLLRVNQIDGATGVYCQTVGYDDLKETLYFEVWRESGDNNFNNLTFRVKEFRVYEESKYRLSRRRIYDLFNPDIITLGLDGAGSNDQLWNLEPFVALTAKYTVNGKKFQNRNMFLEGRWNITTKIPKLSENQEFLGWRIKGGDDTLYQPGQEMPGRRENVTFEAVIQTVTKVGTAVPAPSLKATKKGKITVDWNLFFRKMKYKAIWKKAKYIEIEYSTDKRFQTIDGIKIIKKGTIKKNPKSTISKLKSNKTYYVRARLWDGNTVFSKWSKSVKVKSK